MESLPIDDSNLLNLDLDLAPSPIEQVKWGRRFHQGSSLSRIRINGVVFQRIEEPSKPEATREELKAAHASGKTIQVRLRTNSEVYGWVDCPKPSWVSDVEYRIKPEKPQTAHEFHNPDGLSPEQIGDEYRLLLKAEIHYRDALSNEIQCWSPSSQKFISGPWRGGSHRTYRVPLATWPLMVRELQSKLKATETEPNGLSKDYADSDKEIVELRAKLQAAEKDRDNWEQIAKLREVKPEGSGGETSIKIEEPPEPKAAHLAQQLREAADIVAGDLEWTGTRNFCTGKVQVVESYRQNRIWGLSPLSAIGIGYTIKAIRK